MSDNKGFKLNRAQIVALQALAFELPGDAEFRVWELQPTPAGANHDVGDRKTKLLVDIESEMANATGLRRLRYKLPPTGGRERA